MLKLPLLIALIAPLSARAQEAAPAAATATNDAASAAPQLAGMLPLLFIFLIFYFLLIRPQQKRMKEHQAVLGALKKGDEVVTGGGVVGKITAVDATGDTLTVEIAKGVEVRVLKGSVGGLYGVKPTPKKSVKNDNAVPSRDSVANDN